MNKTIYISLLCLFSAVELYAFKPIRDIDSAQPFSIQDIGVKFVTVGGLIRTSATVTGSSVAIYGVLTSTARITDLSAFVQIRATNTYNTTSELLVPNIKIASTNANTFFEFKVPVIAPGGFALTITSAGTMATVFYQHLATSETTRYRIPIDDDEGAKTYSSSLYGVKAATTVTSGAADDAIGTETLDGNTDEQDVDGSTLSKRMFLYGWAASSGSASSYIVFDDTATIIGAAEPGTTLDVLPPIFFNAMTQDQLTSPNTSSVFYWPWPIIFEDGITAAITTGVDGFRIFSKPTDTLR